MLLGSLAYVNVANERDEARFQLTRAEQAEGERQNLERRQQVEREKLLAQRRSELEKLRPLLSADALRALKRLELRSAAELSVDLLPPADLARTRRGARLPRSRPRAK